MHITLAIPKDNYQFYFGISLENWKHNIYPIFNQHKQKSDDKQPQINDVKNS